jgi:hypothetical protein
MKCEICGKEILRDSQCINYKYYHNDCIENLQQENRHLKIINKEYERLNKENGRGFKITSVKQYNIDELLKCGDNWNKLKKFLKNTRKENLEWDKKHNCEWKGYNAYSELLIKMQELERESDKSE